MTTGSDGSPAGVQGRHWHGSATSSGELQAASHAVSARTKRDASRWQVREQRPRDGVERGKL